MKAFALLLFLFAESCIHSGKKIPLQDRSTIRKIPVTQYSGTAHGTHPTNQELSGSSDWFACEKDQKSPVAILLNPDFSVYKPGVCEDPLAQVFLRNHNVILINRPGFKDPVKPQQSIDLGGELTVFLAETAFRQAMKEMSWNSLKTNGIFAKNTGVISAHELAIRIPSISWLVYGDGVYDMEEFEKDHPTGPYQELIGRVKATLPTSFYEKRSILWRIDERKIDKILIYHTGNQEYFKLSQSQEFQNQLLIAGFPSSQYKEVDNKTELPEILKFIRTTN